MTSQELIEKIQADQGDAVTLAEVTLGDAVIHTSPGALHALAEYLKSDPALQMNYLSHISGVDYLEQDREPRFEAVYEIHSMTLGHTVRVRVGVDEDETVPSVSDIWKGALFPERELFDMFGIEVAGHPNLKRLIMPEDWEDHPLRKDYPLVWEDIAFSHNPGHKSELIKEKPEHQSEN